MAHKLSQSIFYVNEDAIEAEQFRFNTTLAASSSHPPPESKEFDIYQDADREERRVNLIDSTSDGWVYVGAVREKTEVVPKCQPRQTKRVGFLKESLSREGGINDEDTREKDNNKLVAVDGEVLCRNVAQTAKLVGQTIQKLCSSVSSTFKSALKPRAKTNSTAVDMLHENEFPVSTTEPKPRTTTDIKQKEKINQSNGIVAQYANVENEKEDNSNIDSDDDDYTEMSLDQFPVSTTEPKPRTTTDIKQKEKIYKSNGIVTHYANVENGKKDNSNIDSDDDDYTEMSLDQSKKDFLSVKGTGHESDNSYNKCQPTKGANIESSDSDKGYKPVYANNSSVERSLDHIKQEPSVPSLTTSPVPRPRKKQKSVFCTKPRPNPRSKNSCFLFRVNEKQSPSLQSSTLPKLTLSDTNRNLSSSPSRARDHVYQNSHESRDHSRRTPVEVVNKQTVTKDSESSLRNQKQPPLSQSTFPIVIPRVESRHPRRSATSRNRDSDRFDYLDILPDSPTDEFLIESVTTQSSPPPLPTKTCPVIKYMNFESKTLTFEPFDYREGLSIKSPFSPRSRNQERSRLAMSVPTLIEATKMQSAANQTSPVFSSNSQSPPPCPPKAYTNRKNRQSSSLSDFRQQGFTPVHKSKSTSSMLDRDPGYGMRSSQGSLYACRDITRESFIDSCPSLLYGQYEHVDDWVLPQKTGNKKDQNTAKHNPQNTAE